MIKQHDLLAFSLANPTHAEKKVEDYGFAKVSLLETGIVTIEPKQEAQISLVLSAGIHGNETAPMEMVNDILKDILDEKLACSVRLLIIFGNLPAANIGKRFTQVNMNRLFSGAWQKEEGFEAQRAGLIEKTIADFFNGGPDSAQRIHYDLHTAIRGSKYPKFVVYPYLHERPYSAEQMDFLNASGIEAVLLSHQSTTTLSYFSSELHNASAFTVELGQVAPFGENDHSKLTAIRHTLRTLIKDEKLTRSNDGGMKIFQVIDGLNKDADDYQLNIEAGFENFTSFDAGFKLTQSQLSEYLVKQDGDALVFPNAKIPIGQRAGLMVREVALASLELN